MQYITSGLLFSLTIGIRLMPASFIHGMILHSVLWNVSNAVSLHLTEQKLTVEHQTQGMLATIKRRQREQLVPEREKH